METLKERIENNPNLNAYIHEVMLTNGYLGGEFKGIYIYIVEIRNNELVFRFQTMNGEAEIKVIEYELFDQIVSMTTEDERVYEFTFENGYTATYDPYRRNHPYRDLTLLDQKGSLVWCKNTYSKGLNDILEHVYS